MSLLFSLYQQPFGFVTGLIVLSLWSLVWKGIGLWHASRNEQKGWYIAMLILNTAGLLPIIYLIWFKPKEMVKETAAMKEVSVTPAKKASKKKTSKKK